MKQFRALFLQFIFWMLVFALQRAIFLTYYWHSVYLDHIGLVELLYTFVSALKLDISTACYILVIPFILMIIQGFTGTIWINRIINAYVFLVLVIYLLISAGEIGIFDEWKSKLSYRALTYLRNPGEIYNSVSSLKFFLLIFMLIIQVVLLYYFYLKFFTPDKSVNDKWNLRTGLLFSVFIPGLLFLGIRGGFSEIPITSSDSYFSKHNILNIAAVNNGYNLTFSLIDFYQAEDRDQLFDFMPEQEAREIVSKLHHVEKDSTTHILNMERPNIVILLLESWTADVIETLSGDKGITPNFHELERDGLLFTQFYASGNRSQQSLASVFSGLPGLPITTLTDNPQKYNSYPSLVRKFNEEGYYTTFYFGGDLNYGNIRSYLIYNQFKKLVDESDFESGQPKGKLGYHDEVLFKRLLKDIPNLQSPFMLATLTLSSHSPYDFPGDRPLTQFKIQKDFLNSVHYTDEQLGKFFKAVKNKEWYKHTLFIVMADHSHMSQKNMEPGTFHYRRIPLLLLGGALKDEYRGKTDDFLCGNTDIPATILKQLNWPADKFKWSKNIFNPYSPQFAYFELNYGFGWKRNFGRLEANTSVPVYYYFNIPKDEQAEFGKEGEAYVQVLMNEFFSY